MMNALVDTTVVLHLYRKYQPALAWFNNPQRYGITSVTWLEVMQGAKNKSMQATCKWLLSQFEMLYPIVTDQRWAMQQLEHFQFSHHIGKDDCLIASVAHRLQLPLYTHNLKDMIPLLGRLAVQPYS
jgi:predicted nucleic acid-binding protein